ncbi:MAG: aldehyde dehydrogenase family protein, partial [Alphaproteobacteria bacterium]|nr:aldehyde dehydrogenase family protein [Alphaproteobacteria bacterium]
ERIHAVVDEACRNGGRLIGAPPQPGGSEMTPIVVADTPAGSALLREDIFGPVIALATVRDMDQAIGLNGDCPYALGASVFGSPDAARAMARRIDAGVVTINDVIVPTADPRLPFGGHGESGYGTTRGGEGLVALTRPKAVSLRRGRFRPHYEPARPDDRSLFTAYLRAAHGRDWRKRLTAVKSLVRVLMARGTRKP